MTTYRETFAEDLAEEEEFKEYLKNRGIRDLVVVATAEMPTESVISKMLRHNSKARVEKAKRKPNRGRSRNSYRYTNYDTYNRFYSRNKYSNRGSYW